MQENIAEKFLDRLVKWTKNIKISDPLEEGCRLGPVVSGGQVKSGFIYLKYARTTYISVHTSLCLLPNVLSKKGLKKFGGGNIHVHPSLPPL